MHGRRLRDLVDLGPADEGVANTFDPARVPASIRPGPPGSFDENKTTHSVLIRFHPQVTTLTRLTWLDAQNVEHVAFVKGIQDVENRHRELVLLCEEVLTP